MLSPVDLHFPKPPCDTARAPKILRFLSLPCLCPLATRSSARGSSVHQPLPCLCPLATRSSVHAVAASASRCLASTASPPEVARAIAASARRCLASALEPRNQIGFLGRRHCRGRGVCFRSLGLSRSTRSRVRSPEHAFCATHGLDSLSQIPFFLRLRNMLW
jgi:hypothetical protein